MAQRLEMYGTVLSNPCRKHSSPEKTKTRYSFDPRRDRSFCLPTSTQEIPVDTENKTSPLTDLLAVQLQLTEDSHGEIARGFSLQFRQAQLIAQSLSGTARSEAERALIEKLQIAFPTAAKVFENTWERIHQRDLMLDAAATMPWDETAAESDKELFRYLRCACLIAEQRAWFDDAEIIGNAVNLTLAGCASFDVCRAIAKAMGGDTSAARELLIDGSTDDTVQLAAASALMMAGDENWVAVVDRVLACSSDANVRETCRVLQLASRDWA
jgi:hypothetical protein